MVQTANLVSQLSYGVLESGSQPLLDDANNLAPMPDFTALPRRRSSMEAAAQARIAGRVNAAAVSDAERGALLAERAAILKKKFESPLTKAEVRRLEYVRW